MKTQAPIRPTNLKVTSCTKVAVAAPAIVTALQTRRRKLYEKQQQKKYNRLQSIASSNIFSEILHNISTDILTSRT